MKHLLVYTPSFVRSARRLAAKNPRLADDLEASLRTLSDNPFDASLRTHKLKGELKECWASSAGYDLRIVFKFITQDGHKAVLLLAMGTHDEVY